MHHDESRSHNVTAPNLAPRARPVRDWLREPGPTVLDIDTREPDRAPTPEELQRLAEGARRMTEWAEARLDQDLGPRWRRMTGPDVLVARRCLHEANAEALLDALDPADVDTGDTDPSLPLDVLPALPPAAEDVARSITPIHAPPALLGA